MNRIISFRMHDVNNFKSITKLTLIKY